MIGVTESGGPGRRKRKEAAAWPRIVRLEGDVRGLRVEVDAEGLDVGCGRGHGSTYLSELGVIAQPSHLRPATRRQEERQGQTPAPTPARVRASI